MNTHKRSKSKATLTIRFAVLFSAEEYRRLMELANQSGSSAGAVLRQLLRNASPRQGMIESVSK